MKKISEIATVENLQVQQHKKQPSLSESKTYDDGLLKRMFATFSVFYGPSWDKNMSTDELAKITQAVWVTALSGLSRSQVEHGLDSLSGTFAINPNEFRELCCGDDGLHRSGAYRKFDKGRALEKKADPETASKAMQKIRQMMGVRSHV